MTAAAAAAPMQGTYIPQYTPVPPTAVPVEVRPASMHTLLTNNKWPACVHPKENIITPDSPLAHTHKPSIQAFLNPLTASADQNIH